LYNTGYRASSIEHPASNIKHLLKGDFMQKKITLFIFLFVVFALAVNAQSVFNKPWPGATHHYTATVTDPEKDNPVRWWVSTDPLGETKAVYNTDYSFVTPGYNATTNRLEGVAAYDVQIKWGTGIANNTDYYIVIEAEEKTTGCSNRSTFPVKIQSSFNALAWDVTGSATPGTIIKGGAGDDTVDPTCPDPVVNPLWDGDSPTDIGSSELVFRVNRERSLLNWQFEFEISEGTAQPVTISGIRFVDDTGNTLSVSNQAADLTGGQVSVNSTEDWVLAYVTVRNQPGVTLDINFDLITSNNLTRDAGNNYDNGSTDNSADHTIQPMPVITNFGGN